MTGRYCLAGARGRLIAVGTREELRLQSGADGALEETFLALTAQEEEGMA